MSQNQEAADRDILMEEIDLCRLALEKRVLRLGISHPEVVEFSQMLDKLIILVQRSSG